MLTRDGALMVAEYLLNNINGMKIELMKWEEGEIRSVIIDVAVDNKRLEEQEAGGAFNIIITSVNNMANYLGWYVSRAILLKDETEIAHVWAQGDIQIRIQEELVVFVVVASVLY